MNSKFSIEELYENYIFLIEKKNSNKQFSQDLFLFVCYRSFNLIYSNVLNFFEDIKHFNKTNYRTIKDTIYMTFILIYFFIGNVIDSVCSHNKDIFIRCCERHIKDLFDKDYPKHYYEFVFCSLYNYSKESLNLIDNLFNDGIIGSLDIKIINKKSSEQTICKENEIYTFVKYNTIFFD